MTVALPPPKRLPIEGMSMPHDEYYLRLAVERLIASQGYIECFICGEALVLAKDVHIDHDHTTGFLRGLLCRSCNLGLGDFEDQPGLMRRAADYLEAAPAPFPL